MHKVSRLAEVKALLAKLLAQEDITIEHLDVASASFDTDQRILTLPIWKDMTGELYDLLTGHEVGHALYTPRKVWDEIGKEKGSRFQGFLNVVEDARIEKKIKRKYPGLRRIFVGAYKTFLDRDLFGIAKLNGDTSELNLIDRINLHCKCGLHINVQFNEEEIVFLKLVEGTETFEEVLEVTQKIWDYVKDQEKDKINDTKKLKCSGGDSSGPGTGDSISNPESDSGGGGDHDPQNPSDEEMEPESVTDSTYRQRERGLVDLKSLPHIFLDLPECDLEKTIIPFKTIVNYYEYTVHNTLYKCKQTYKDLADSLIFSFSKHNEPYISLLVKEFEMRKNATQYARQMESKSGELDMGRLYRYKFTNDIFRKFTEVPKGKNHGMVMFVDMSISMQPVFKNTMQQTLILATFCKKVGIPFEVYGFSDSSETYYPGEDKNYVSPKFSANTPAAFNFFSACFHLKTLVSSDLNAKDFRRAMGMLLILGEHMDGSIMALSDMTGNITLNGTPFNDTLVASKQIINRFKKKTRVDITNVVYLTDGEGEESINYPNMYSRYQIAYDHASSHHLGFTDPETKKRVALEPKESIQSGLTRLIRDITGCRHIGFYITSESSLFRKKMEILERISDSEKKFEVSTEIEKSISANKFFKYPNIGYDSYYYVMAKTGSIGNFKFKTNAKAAVTISKDFLDHQNKKKIDRVLVTSFASEISTNV